MDRRSLLKGGVLASLSLPFMGFEKVLTPDTALLNTRKKAKNIIMMVSDGMSVGTLSMADTYSQRALGKGSVWMNLYRENKVVRALMDTASASSSVTDSAAASSSWGGGMRVRNGSLNVGMKGEKPQPILQKFKEQGKKVGCVTTVPVTHATPAGFCVNIDDRNGQGLIAGYYLDLKFDVMLGGGSKYFGSQRKGGSLLPQYQQRGFQVVQNSAELQLAQSDKPVLGLFAEDGLPYELDRVNDSDLRQNVPSLAQMTAKAIELMKDHEAGFVMQVEGGKVDWAAHANDVGGLIFDQLAFDEAVGKAIEFAEQDGETLVIITTDHGNANPGLYYSDNADQQFDQLQKFKHSNTWLLSQINHTHSANQIRERIREQQGLEVKKEDVNALLSHYKDAVPGQLYNEAQLPLFEYGRLMSQYTSVHWGGIEHTNDYVELAMYGPGSELLPSFVKNYQLHNLMLEAAQMPASFLVK